MHALIALLLACRPDPGAPVYPHPPPWNGDTGDGFLEGPDPWVDGVPRLSLGYFYEGGYSEVLAPENLYIYDNTFAIGTSDLRVEGLRSEVWTHAGKAWWGGGLHYDAAQDLSAWTTLHLHLMAPASGGLPAVDLALQGGGNEGRLDAADYGFVADGAWHALSVPMADFAAPGADLTQVDVPLILVGEVGTAGDLLYIDNLYLD